jgi:NAD(P)-dependent dehydrogenase (short-subunit alcohol dehydrogenase family)
MVASLTDAAAQFFSDFQASELFFLEKQVLMARIFITGSSDGLGLAAAQLLVEQGHSVVLHARSQQRADEAHNELSAAESVVVGDLSSINQTRHVAEQANQLGSFDAVIHNAGIGYREPTRVVTEDGLSHVLAVNTIAPYILTALITRPKRLVYLSSVLHQAGDPSLSDLTWADRPWSGRQAYCDTKLHDVLLAFAISRRWPSVLSNALEPGWVPTKMGGSGATDDLDQAHRTQVWLAVSDDPAALVSGEYFYHMQKRDPLPAARDTSIQDRLLDFCSRVTGVTIPASTPHAQTTPEK